MFESSAAPRRDPVRLVLVGGGHANVALLKAAGRLVEAGVRVTLVSDRRFLFYSGMTPEHVGGVYREAELRVDLLRWCLAGRVRFVESPAARLDVARRVVTTRDGEDHAGDLVVFDIGGVNPRPDRAGNALRTKPLARLEGLVDWLAAPPSPGRSLVIVGGGPAGTEVMLNVSARPDARRLRLTLVEPGERLLGRFAPALSRRAEALLRARGVDVRLRARVARVEEGAVVLEGGERVPQDLVVWATGTRGQPLFEEAGLAVDERGFVRVGRDLRVPGRPWLFAAGDCAAVDGLALDRSGVNAVKQGLTLRANVTRAALALLAGRDPADLTLAPFRPYPVAPYLVSTGEREALLALGPRVGLRGAPLLALKHLADRVWVGRYQFRE